MPCSFVVADVLHWAVPTHLVLAVMQYGYAGQHGPDALPPLVTVTWGWVASLDAMVQSLSLQARVARAVPPPVSFHACLPRWRRGGGGVVPVGS